MPSLQLTLSDYAGARLRSIAYADGFAHGTDPERAERHDVVAASASGDWWCGFEAGRRAADRAARVYLERQLASCERDRSSW